jgi:hypothetical protein
MQACKPLLICAALDGLACCSDGPGPELHPAGLFQHEQSIAPIRRPRQAGVLLAGRIVRDRRAVRDDVAKCEANAYGSPSIAASCAPNRLDPRIQASTSRPAPGAGELLLNNTLPLNAITHTWKTLFARSIPTSLTFMTDASFLSTVCAATQSGSTKP